MIWARMLAYITGTVDQELVAGELLFRQPSPNENAVRRECL
jgi:hypothetical protein